MERLRISDAAVADRYAKGALVLVRAGRREFRKQLPDRHSAEALRDRVRAKGDIDPALWQETTVVATAEDGRTITLESTGDGANPYKVVAILRASGEAPIDDAKVHRAVESLGFQLGYFGGHVLRPYDSGYQPERTDDGDRLFSVYLYKD